MKRGVVTFDAGNTLFTERIGRDEMYVRVLRAHGIELTVDAMAELRHGIHDGMPEVVNGHLRYTDGWFSVYIERLLGEVGGGSAAPVD